LGRLRRRPWGLAAGHPWPGRGSRPRLPGTDARRNGPRDDGRRPAQKLVKPRPDPGGGTPTDPC